MQILAINFCFEPFFKSQSRLQGSAVLQRDHRSDSDPGRRRHRKHVKAFTCVPPPTK